MNFTRWSARLPGTQRRAAARTEHTAAPTAAPDKRGEGSVPAARVEQLTKSTGDTILLTQHTVDALASYLAAPVDRGQHALKGKSDAVQIFGLQPAAPGSSMYR